MERSLYNNHQFEERENSSSENSAGGSPPSTTRASVHPISFPKTRRGIQKRVVTVPLNGDYTSTTPPSDSWAWRKYGQKPIKGSPYPRGYYRCSSSKGCPARKQVERSRSDPTLLLVTYSYDHNHSFPVSRNHSNAAAASGATLLDVGLKIEEPHLLIESTPAAIPNNSDNNNQHLRDEKFTDLAADVESLITATDDFDWTFANMDTTSSAILDDPIFSNTSTGRDLRYFPAMGEEEESLFADLGELPECSVVFGGGGGRGSPEAVRVRVAGTVVLEHRAGEGG